MIICLIINIINMRRDRSKSPKPSFRNTRSKFFKKKNLN